MVHSVIGWTRGVQVKLWDLLRTRAIPERLRGVFTMRCYTNPRLPLPSWTTEGSELKITQILVVLARWTGQVFKVKGSIMVKEILQTCLLVSRWKHMNRNLPMPSPKLNLRKICEGENRRQWKGKKNDWLIDWVRLNVPPTQYRSYGDGFLRVKWPN